MKRSIAVLISVMSILMLMVTSGIASVTSLAVDQKIHPGSRVHIPLQLTSDQQVAGVNGVFTYDPNIFTNPRMDNGVAAINFIVEGYERPDDPGNFRYVIYADPTATMNLAAGAAVFFMLDVKAGLADSTITHITYTPSAASNPLGESLADVNFATTRIEISTGTDDWALYE